MENIKPKIDNKGDIISKIKKGNYTPDQIVKWIQSLPDKSNRKPSISKKGDVYMHPVFKHPYVLLEKKSGYWLCGLITSEPECSEILEACESRFFTNAFFTRTIFTTVQPVGSYMNVFDNPKQLRSILLQLKNIMS